MRRFGLAPHPVTAGHFQTVLFADAMNPSVSAASSRFAHPRRQSAGAGRCARLERLVAGLVAGRGPTRGRRYA